MSDLYRARRKVIETEIPALVAGSEVYYLGRNFGRSSGDAPIVRKVARVTNTHVILADRDGSESSERFYRTPSGGRFPNASRIGESVEADRFHRSRIEPITPEFRAEYEAEAARKALVSEGIGAFLHISELFGLFSGRYRVESRSDEDIRFFSAFSNAFASFEAEKRAVDATIVRGEGESYTDYEGRRSAAFAALATPFRRFLAATGARLETEKERYLRAETEFFELERLAAEPGYYEAGGNAEAVAFLVSRGIETERARAFVAERSGPAPEGSER